MNEKEAREILSSGVIPGDIDSIDLREAKGYLEAIEKAKVLEEGLQKILELVNYEGSSAFYPILQLITDIQTDAKEALSPWEKVK